MISAIELAVINSEDTSFIEVPIGSIYSKRHSSILQSQFELLRSAISLDLTILSNLGSSRVAVKLSSFLSLTLLEPLMLIVINRLGTYFIPFQWRIMEPSIDKSPTASIAALGSPARRLNLFIAIDKMLLWISDVFFVFISFWEALLIHVNGSSHRESPTRATVTLVVDFSSTTLSYPVNRG